MPEKLEINALACSLPIVRLAAAVRAAEAGADVHPGAQELCDGRDNDCDENVDEGVVEASINKTEVWPQKTGGDTEAAVTLRLNGPAGANGCTVELRVEPVPNTGGHEHTGSRPSDKIGRLSRYTVPFSSGSSGPEGVTYTSSEISEDERIYYRVKNGAGVTSSLAGDTVTVRGVGWEGPLPIRVRVPGLVALSSNQYDLKCNIYSCAGYEHEDFYNVQPWVRTRFSDIACKYRQRFSMDNKLIVNDGSLLWGGLYDYKNTWNPPHGTHRIGTDVDVRSKDIPIRNRLEFKKIACQEKVFPKLEYPGMINEHYHLYFKSYRASHYDLCRGYW